MRMIVLGGGIVGVTSAYFLAEAGHEVTLIERQPNVALETSFANAGQVSPGYAAPWAAPGLPLKAIGWLLARHAPLIIHPSLDPALLRWMAAMLRNCTADRYAVNKARMVRLAEYSRDQLIALRDQTGIRYDHRTYGTLQLFRTQRQLDHSTADVQVLQASGVRFEQLDRAGCIAAEPGLANAAINIAGGLRLPGDETGDCFKFANALADLARARGVQILSGATILGLDIEHGRVAGVRTNLGTFHADRYLLALGSFSPGTAKAAGIKLPIYPVKGYSLTAPLVDADAAPVSTVLDESYKVAITRLGNRVRVGGMAELAGFNMSLSQRRRATLEQSLGDLFPATADTTIASFWTGLRPMTPDGTPIIGPTRLPNLFLNCGHGTLGWTMSCGSGRIIADLMSDRAPDIETADLALSRYA